jgi:hypothetical protein
MMRRRIQGLIAASLVVGGLLAFSGIASASYHLDRIRQIHPSLGPLGGEWVELQMPADGENLVAGKVIRTFDPSGMQNSLYVIGAGPGPHPGSPNGQNQRTILISSLFTPVGVAADYVAPVADLQMTGQDGAVCYTENDPPNYTPLDCVAYGSFTGNNIPSAGTPAVATPFESTLERSITRGCATAFDSADDTNNSSTDFALSMNPPRSNASPPTEQTCTGAGTGTAPTTPPSPAKKCNKKKHRSAEAAKKKKCKKKR